MVVEYIGGTSQQRSWAQAVVQGSPFNYTVITNPNPPPTTIQQPVHGSQVWLTATGRRLDFRNLVLPGYAAQYEHVFEHQSSPSELGERYDVVGFGTYPEASSNLKITFVNEPPPGHNEFAATEYFPSVPGVSAEYWKISVRNDLDSPSRPEPFTGQNFFQETIAHELGHVMTSIVFKKMGATQAIAKFRQMFNAPSAPWDTGPWEGQLKEAVAEFYKDMIWPTRKFNSRADIKLPRANYETWLRVMMDLFWASPPDSINYWYAFNIGYNQNYMPSFDRQHGASGPPTPEPAGEIPGDLYSYFAWNNYPHGTLSWGISGGYSIPVYGKWIDPNPGGGARGFTRILWSGFDRSSGQWTQGSNSPPLPEDPIFLSVIYEYQLGDGYTFTGLDFNDFVHTHVNVYAEWYVTADFNVLNSSHLVERTKIGSIIGAVKDTVLECHSPVTPDEVQDKYLLLYFCMDGVFPNTQAINGYCIPDHSFQAVAFLPWRYQDPPETEPGWFEPRWAYDETPGLSGQLFPSPRGAREPETENLYFEQVEVPDTDVIGAVWAEPQ